MSYSLMQLLFVPEKQMNSFTVFSVHLQIMASVKFQYPNMKATKNNEPHQNDNSLADDGGRPHKGATVSEMAKMGNAQLCSPSVPNNIVKQEN